MVSLKSAANFIMMSQWVYYDHLAAEKNGEFKKDLS